MHIDHTMQDLAHVKSFFFKVFRVQYTVYSTINCTQFKKSFDNSVFYKSMDINNVLIQAKRSRLVVTSGTLPTSFNLLLILLN